MLYRIEEMQLPFKREQIWATLIASNWKEEIAIDRLLTGQAA